MAIVLNAKGSKMTYFGAEFYGAKNKRCEKRFAKKHLIFVNCQDFEKWQNVHFAKAIVRQFGPKWPIFGLNLKVPKTYQKRL